MDRETLERKLENRNVANTLEIIYRDLHRTEKDLLKMQEKGIKRDFVHTMGGNVVTIRNYADSYEEFYEEELGSTFGEMKINGSEYHDCLMESILYLIDNAGIKI